MTRKDYVVPRPRIIIDATSTSPAAAQALAVSLRGAMSPLAVDEEVRDSINGNQISIDKFFSSPLSEVKSSQQSIVSLFTSSSIGALISVDKLNVTTHLCPHGDANPYPCSSKQAQLSRWNPRIEDAKGGEGEGR